MGVRYRLGPGIRAEPLRGRTVGWSGVPRLLNTSTRPVVERNNRALSARCQQRIATERERADPNPAEASSLDQLARARLSSQLLRAALAGWPTAHPAVARALATTVPLFAAVASFYSQSGYGTFAAGARCLMRHSPVLRRRARTHWPLSGIRSRLHHHQRERYHVMPSCRGFRSAIVGAKGVGGVRFAGAGTAVRWMSRTAGSSLRQSSRQSTR